MKILLIGVSALLALYIILSPRAASFLYSGRLFFPEHYPSGNYQGVCVHGVTRQDVSFKAPNGNSLHGWYFKLPNSHYVALLHHGNRGNLTTPSHLAPVELLLGSRVSVLIYDYEGYGKSEGKPSLKGIMADGFAAYNFLLTNLGYKPNQIIEYGESLGCAVAAHLAVSTPCAGVILQSGFASLERIGKEVMPLVRIYPSFLFPLPRLDTETALKAPHPPLLIFHGREDLVVPFAHAEAIYKSASPPKRLVVLPDTAHHNILEHDRELAETAIEQFIAGLKSPQQVATPGRF